MMQTGTWQELLFCPLMFLNVCVGEEASTRKKKKKGGGEGKIENKKKKKGDRRKREGDKERESRRDWLQKAAGPRPLPFHGLALR